MILTIRVLNPFTGAMQSIDVRATEEQRLEMSQGLSFEELEALEGYDTPASWIAALADIFGPKRAGEIILNP